MLLCQGKPKTDPTPGCWILELVGCIGIIYDFIEEQSNVKSLVDHIIGRRIDRIHFLT